MIEESYSIDAEGIVNGGRRWDITSEKFSVSFLQIGQLWPSRREGCRYLVPSAGGNIVGFEQ